MTKGSGKDQEKRYIKDISGTNRKKASGGNCTHDLQISGIISLDMPALDCTSLPQ